MGSLDKSVEDFGTVFVSFRTRSRRIRTLEVIVIRSKYFINPNLGEQTSILYSFLDENDNVDNSMPDRARVKRAFMIRLRGSWLFETAHVISCASHFCRTSPLGFCDSIIKLPKIATEDSERESIEHK